MSEEFEVHGAHDHAVEHAAHTERLGRWVAMFTAILATLGAYVSYQNGNAESRGLEFKNEAILKKSAASDQWAFYQAKGIKELIVANAVAPTEADRARLSAEAARYAAEKKAIQEQAKKLDEESRTSDEASAVAIAPHHHLAQALAMIQAAIAMAALTVLTRQRWMLVFSGACAAGGIAFWFLAFH
jgi:hypothetical protein